ncbi:MAG: Yip1 family protein, partial [Hyphomicrobium sp.]|nr:Yip1 family protein [Hyphomicrobium sp.]
MTSTDPGSSVRAPLIERIKNILLNPRAEWPRIAAEPETVGSLYTNYIVPVAGFAVLCSFVSSLIGVNVLGVTYRPTYWQALSSGVWQLVFTLGGTYVVALVMGYLAKLFGGENNNVNALKLTAYAATAGWLSNIFLLVPGLGFLTILGIYTLYLIYTGAPVLLNVPPARALPFTASLVAISIVTTLLIIGLTTAFGSGGGGIPADAQRH